MAKAAAKDSPTEVELVSPNGEIKRKVAEGSKEEVSLRFDGYLPAEQQKLEAPEKPAVEGPKTVTNSSSTGV